MIKKINRLSARSVATLTKPGRHADGGGLYLTIAASGAKRWTFMYERAGRQREAGLGSANAVPLAKARSVAASFREILAGGGDPIEDRQAERRTHDRRRTFGEVADDVLASKEASWRNAKHRAQWRMTLTHYAAPLRDVPVADIDTQAVLAVLQPIWQTKTVTASRLRGRIEAVLDAARAAGYIGANEANPARWRGHLETLLSKPRKLSGGHHAAMPYADVPAFLARLRERQSTAALALEFLILTAARSGEVLGATWSEIDIDKKIWTVPAARMKASREHRVPLCDRVLTILETLAKVRTGAFIFPGQRPDGSLSGMALVMILRRMKIDATVHGFRSSFRDWAGEETQVAREIAEAALAHVSGDATERAYRRGDALERRRLLMDAWASYCEPAAAGKARKVVPIRTRRNGQTSPGQVGR